MTAKVASLQNLLCRWTF